MVVLATVLLVLVALLHLYFLVLEMFLWTSPYGRRVFGVSAEQAAATRVLAANQGLYNGFLAAGLFWGLLAQPPQFATAIKVFFLGCVVAAGLFGAATVSRRILVLQALPAGLALAAVLLAR
jgi:putative membrane protein